jgi:NAD(P)-dependent dehydrogenase (short-subunit alcohol dehydrogenase family)
MRENLELNGRRAFVTGGTQGIGEAVVAKLV